MYLPPTYDLPKSKEFAFWIIQWRRDPNNESGEYKEKFFKTRKEITEYLNISMNNLVNMLNHDFKCNLQKHKHLKGIKIERINEDEPDPIDPVEFRKKLLENIWRVLYDFIQK